VNIVHYEIGTLVISLLSLILFIGLIVFHKVKKIKFKGIEYLVIVILLLGMYQFIPRTLYNRGVVFSNIKLIEKAQKISVNPVEKRICDMAMADIYSNNKDGLKMIEYIEKSIKGEYKKYPEPTEILAMTYLLKGDYDKVLEINQNLGNKDIERAAYIMKSDYKKALETFDEKEGRASISYLKAALYKEIGNNNMYLKTKKIADEQYEVQKVEYDSIESFKTVNNYKIWISRAAADYGF